MFSSLYVSHTSIKCFSKTQRKTKTYEIKKKKIPYSALEPMNQNFQMVSENKNKPINKTP